MARSQSLELVDFDSHYQRLGLKGEVTWEQVQKAYRRLAQRLHPDKSDGGDPTAFRELNKAYRELKRYHDKFGLLPSGEAATTTPPQRPETQRARAPQPAPRRQFGPLSLLAILALPPLLYLLWPKPPAGQTPYVLRAPSSAQAPAATTEAWVTLGMTKQEVRDIQGRPILREQREWDYGVSKIYFENGLVTGWYNSRSGPLRVTPGHYGWHGEDRRQPRH